MKSFKLIICILFFSPCLVLSQWVSVLQLPSGSSPPQAFSDNGNNRLYAAMTGKKIYSTTNDGLNWSFSGTGLDSTGHIYSISAKDSIVFVSTQNGIYRSTDNGLTYYHLINDIGAWTSKANIIISNNIYAGFLSGLYKSTNFGNNWVVFNNGFPQYPSILSLSYSNNIIYAGLDGSNTGIYKSTNFGENWLRINNGIPDNFPYSIYSYSNLVLVGTAMGVYISTNYGSNWRLIPEISGNIGILGLSSIGTQTIFISAWEYGVYVSTNGGLNWVSKNEGLMCLRVTAMYIFNNYVYLGMNPYDYSREILRRPISEMVSVSENNSILPKDYKLFQNYPNPFNPVTTIKFDIANGFRKKTFGNYTVVLKVFDNMGREVQTLVNETLTQGSYEVTFNGSNLSSGIYYYKLETANYSQTKKMLLIK